MKNLSRYERYTRSSAPQWAYFKYGVLILLAAATAYIVFLALTK
jgi:hypothetical protein